MSTLYTISGTVTLESDPASARVLLLESETGEFRAEVQSDPNTGAYQFESTGVGELIPGDPQWSSVSALLHFDGDDNSTTIIEETGLSVSATGGAELSTTDKRFGVTSCLFVGAGSYLYIVLPEGGLGSGDFTVECYVKPSDVTNAGIFQLSDTIGGFKTSGRGLVLNFNSGGGGIGYSLPGVDGFIASQPVATNVWMHIAIARSGSTVRIFRNGFLAASLTNSGDLSSCRYLIIGGYYSSTYCLQGMVDEFRITKGYCRYTDKFSTPVEPFKGPDAYDDSAVMAPGETYFLLCDYGSGVRPLAHGPITPQETTV